jgi:uracil-DNA glycosylase
VQATLDLGESGPAPGSWADLDDPGVLPGWRPLLDRFRASPQGQQLQAFLCARQAQGAVVYPPQPLRVFTLTPPDDVCVVILGQDPYHGAGQAEGLAFSVAPGVTPPPSLRNIFKERQRDLGLPLPRDGSLVRWAQQGVLLLNASLTVEAGRPASHAGQGWEALTDAVIQQCSEAGGPKVFMLWGAHAQKKAPGIDTRRHLVLRANHPSPLSALKPPVPFIGCGHFGQANEWLARQGRSPLVW